jgi:hypothetical protein
MIIPPFGLCRRKLNTTQMLGPQLILTVTAPASRTRLCKPCANCLKLKEIWAMIREAARASDRRTPKPDKFAL